MEDEVDRLGILRITDGKAEKLSDDVSRERAATLFLNGVELATFMCSPGDLDCLAVGFLRAEGIIGDRKDLKRVHAEEREGTVRVDTTSHWDSSSKDPQTRSIAMNGGKKVTVASGPDEDLTLPLRSSLRISHASVHSLLKTFLGQSKTYALTGAVHAAAVCEENNILVFKEDIGRRNAIDKAIGECVIKGIQTADRIILTSGRVASETVVRAARIRAPVIISKAAPTDLAVKLADDFGITVVGFARERRMNVYSHHSRIIIEPPKE